MRGVVAVLLVLRCWELAYSVDLRAEPENEGCTIDFECEECLPDSMPIVTSHNSSRGQLRLAHNEPAVLWCGAGRFMADNRAMLNVRCSRGRYRLPDGTSKHLLELGCQQDVIEDVLHPVAHCGGDGLQGRVYRVAGAAGAAQHLAALCFDADRALPLRALATPAHYLPLPPHKEARAPLSLFGNFNEMFDARNRRDAERLFSDDVKLNHRFRELLKPHHPSLGEQTLTTAPLLSSKYFSSQEIRAAKIPSNRVVAWRGVAHGNWKHLQHDVANLSRRMPQLYVYSGTHGVGSIRGDTERVPLVAGSQGRFPVPRYLWSVVHDPQSNRALALMVLNDPLVAVSEVREAVFCESACGRVAWLAELTRQRRYESPALGLTFCCFVHDIVRITEFPQDIVKNVSRSLEGALFDVV